MPRQTKAVLAEENAELQRQLDAATADNAALRRANTQISRHRGSLAAQTTSLRRRITQLERDLTHYRDLCMDQMRRNAEQAAEHAAALEPKPRVIEGEVVRPLKAVTA